MLDIVYSLRFTRHLVLEGGGGDDGGDEVGKEIQSLAETGVLSIFSFLL